MTDREKSTLPECENKVIETYFDGDRVLYMAFRESCLQQFECDLDEGQAAIDDQDIETLRRVAHSLKGVLRTIGYDALSDQAKSIENAAYAKDTPVAVRGWGEFDQVLRETFGLARS